MNLQDHILGYQCSNRACGYSSLEQFQPCPQCGNTEPRPIYDFYKVLGVSPDVSSSQLSSAYRKLSLKYHPDVNKAGREQFLVISEAYQTLKSDNDRASYDSLVSRIGNTGTGYTSQGFPGAGQQSGAYYYRTFTEKDFEEIFRAFHQFGQRREVTLEQIQGITGMLGGILGFIASFFIPLPPIIRFALPFIGYFLGRMSPGMGNVLLSLTNSIVLISFFLVALKTGMNLVVILPMFFILIMYYGMSRRWARILASVRRG